MNDSNILNIDYSIFTSNDIDIPVKHTPIHLKCAHLTGVCSFSYLEAQSNSTRRVCKSSAASYWRIALKS